MIFKFYLHINYQQFLDYYQGHANKVEVVEQGGKTLLIHARHFRPFLTSAGLSGQFQLTLDTSGQFQSLVRLA
ncbi:DUF2835 domain-containing protein [Shewanella sp. Isolate11]|uniref:DUF2835 domain-containing protein n=1 Tax=Shewanella sp. Isolate11 TaxID=2908530 RepID=UPI001EFC54F7|nr:DUF2835 domain-containing protein [Shewanella sp. Isolate11]MCG9696497.1 DUF2835 domain-containing protein [Shewanella sp. Isolate11]